jgi:condensin complex subunit 3
MANIEDSIRVYIQDQFEAFQLDDDDLGSGIAASRRMSATIQKHVHILVLNSNKNGNNTNSSGVVSEYLTPVLTQYVDAALTTEIDLENKDAVDRVLNLVVALSLGLCLSSKSNYCLQTILDRIELFSDCTSEKNRSQACVLLGCFACHIECVKDDVDWKNDCLAAIETMLLPRLTDKSQLARQRAIQATGSMLLASTTKPSAGQEGHDDDDDDESITTPTLLEPLLWSMWHDPSVANRIEAIRAVPIDSAETLNHVITRIRDVKEKVRVAAIEKIQEVPIAFYNTIMTEDHFCEIVKFGLTERCEFTKCATTELICCKFMKGAKFCPVEMMRLMGATTHEEEAEKALGAVLKTARSTTTNRNIILKDLSDPEIRSFDENINKSMIKLDKDCIFDEYQIFYTRVACSTAKESSELTFTQKEDLMTRTTPDIPTLCDLFQKHLKRLMESIQEQDEESEEQEGFVCMEFLKLAKMADIQEEGSRRYFSNVMTNVLANVETPDELVEECVEALRTTSEDDFDFFNAISMIATEINDSSVDASLEKEKESRVLLLFSIVLENAPSRLSTHDLLDGMTKIILSSVASSKKMVREISIGALGKLGLFSDESTVLSEFKPILLRIAAKDVALECRGQALLGLSDWALLFSGILKPYQFDSNPEGESLSLVLILQEMIEHTNTSMAAIAAEVATKLLFSVQIGENNTSCNANEILAALLVSFLDPNNNPQENIDEDVDIKDVGSPVRLQQLLSLFFPSFSFKSDGCRSALLSSIEKALEAAMLISSGKSKAKKRSLVFPLVKVCEYVCSIVMDGGAASKGAAVDENVDNNTSEIINKENSGLVALSASLQVSRFLVKNGAKLTVTHLRSLCKFIGNQVEEIQVDDGDKAQLGKLKDCMEELDFLDDSTSLKALRPLTELLSKVVGYEENNDDDDDEEEEDFDTFSDDENASESSSKEKDVESTGETTIEDEVMLDSIARLSILNKENPPSEIKTSRRKNRRSSNQSNISVLETLQSP